MQFGSQAVVAVTLATAPGDDRRPPLRLNYTATEAQLLCHLSSATPPPLSKTRPPLVFKTLALRVIAAPKREKKP